MRSILIFALATFLCLTLTTPIHAQNVRPTTEPASETSSDAKPTQEVLLLRTQIAETHRFQDQVLNTVYWSLSTLAGIGVLLVGFNWWNNNYAYERDKLLLEKELQVALSQKMQETRQELAALLEKQSSDLREDTTLLVTSNADRLEEILQSKNTELEKHLSQQLAALKGSIRSLNNEVKELFLEAELNRRLGIRAEKLYRNALQSSVTALELALAIGDEMHQADILDNMAEDLSSIIKDDDLPIDNFLLSQVFEVLDSVTGSHAHAAAIIKQKARNLASA